MLGTDDVIEASYYGSQRAGSGRRPEYRMGRFLGWNDEGDECDVDLSKFAELIVRECIRIDIENPDAAPGVEIAKHFGVE